MTDDDTELGEAAYRQ